MRKSILGLSPVFLASYSVASLGQSDWIYYILFCIRKNPSLHPLRAVFFLFQNVFCTLILQLASAFGDIPLWMYDVDTRLSIGTT